MFFTNYILCIWAVILSYYMHPNSFRVQLKWNKSKKKTMTNLCKRSSLFVLFIWIIIKKNSNLFDTVAAPFIGCWNLSNKKWKFWTKKNFDQNMLSHLQRTIKDKLTFFSPKHRKTQLSSFFPFIFSFLYGK